MDLQRVFGDIKVRADESEDAARFFEGAINVFEHLTTEFETIESQGHASDKNISQSPSSEGSDRRDLVPSALALILRQQSALPIIKSFEYLHHFRSLVVARYSGR